MEKYKKADGGKKMNVRFCGIGGQGIVLAGYILGKAAINEGCNAMQTKTYGSAYRGTLCKSDVIISKDRICEIEFEDADVLICFSNDCFSKYKNGLKHNGHLFFDDTLVDISSPPANYHCMSVFDLSKDTFNTTIFGNIIMLGYVTSIFPVVSQNTLMESITETVPKHTIEKNIHAFSIGYQKGINKNE